MRNGTAILLGGVATMQRAAVCSLAVAQYDDASAVMSSSFDQR
jgi:hypothetical protein